MDVLPNKLPYEIKLEIYKYTDLETAINLGVKDLRLLDYLYKKSDVKCYKDLYSYKNLEKVLLYIKDHTSLKVKYTDFSFNEYRIVKNKYTLSLIEILGITDQELIKFEDENNPGIYIYSFEIFPGTLPLPSGVINRSDI